MRFATWLKKQTERHDIVGDLARDYVRDPDAPRDIQRLRKYLGLIACTEALEAFEEAVDEYRNA